MSQTHYTPRNTHLQHGELRGDTYCKIVSGSRHMLKRPPAWAVDCRDLVEAERLGATRVEIFDLETQVTYASNIEYFRAHALRLDRGFGAQLALEIHRWSTIGELQTGGISAVKSERPKPQTRQLGLFEEARREPR